MGQIIRQTPHPGKGLDVPVVAETRPPKLFTAPTHVGERPSDRNTSGLVGNPPSVTRTYCARKSWKTKDPGVSLALIPRIRADRQWGPLCLVRSKPMGKFPQDDPGESPFVDRSAVRISWIRTRLTSEFFVRGNLRLSYVRVTNATGCAYGPV